MDHIIQSAHTISCELAQQAKALIDDANVIHIFTHVNPDGDAVASVRAFELVLCHWGKTVVCRFSEPLPEMYEWLGVNVVTGKYLPAPDLIVTVDLVRLNFSSLEECIRMGLESNIPVLNIDHHPDNHMFGTVNIVIESSSNTQNLYKLFQLWTISIDESLATALLFGLVYDTYFFQRSNSDYEAFATAAALAKISNKVHFVSQKLYKSRTLESLDLLGQVLGSLESHCQGSLLIGVVSYQTFVRYRGREIDFPGLSNFLSGIKGLRILALLKQFDTKTIEIGFRSEPIFDDRGQIVMEAPDVSRIARQFGGGGHVVAAGCSIQGNLEEVKSMILEACLKILDCGQP